MDKHESETNRHRCRSSNRLLCRGSEDHEQEPCRHHDFGNESSSEVEPARRMIAVTICSKTVDLEIEASTTRSNRPDRKCSENCADHLNDHIRKDFLGRETLRDPQTDGDGRVEVTTGNVTNRVGHGQNSEAECERNANKSDTQLNAIAAADQFCCQYGATAATEHEPERADRFGDELFAHVHRFPLGVKGIAGSRRRRKR